MNDDGFIRDKKDIISNRNFWNELFDGKGLPLGKIVERSKNIKKAISDTYSYINTVNSTTTTTTTLPSNNSAVLSHAKIKEIRNEINSLGNIVVCEFPLLVGCNPDLNQNPALAYICDSWRNNQKKSCVSVLTGINRWASFLSRYDFLLILSGLSDGTSCDLFCEYDGIDYIPFDISLTKGLLVNNTPLFIRLKVRTPIVDIKQDIIQHGFFYITGEIELDDDNEIGLFEMKNLMFVNKNNKIVPHQVLLYL